LSPFDPIDAGELCRLLLRPVENVPEQALERLVARSQGIPLHLVELVRGLRRDGLIRQRADCEPWFVATDDLERIPDAPLVEWLAHRELEVLSPELAVHARLAALLGPHFSMADVEGILSELEKNGDDTQFLLDAQVGTKHLVKTGLLVRERDEVL